MKPIEAYSRFILGLLTCDEILQLANAWLEQGIYAPSLGEIIFEKPPIMSTVGSMFDQAMKELKIKEPSRMVASKILINLTLTQIIDGEIQPEEGASFLYWDIHHKLDDKLKDKKYVGDCLGLEHIFCWLREIWDCKDGSMILYYKDLPRNEAEIKFKKHLVEEAKNYLKKNKNITKSLQ